MNLTEWSKKVNKTAVEHGWHLEGKEPSFGEVVALCHSELSEALQAYREGQPMRYVDGHGKPDGVAVEMADCLIRILDWAGQNGIDMESIVKQKDIYNKSRPYRHGGKRASIHIQPTTVKEVHMVHWKKGNGHTRTLQNKLRMSKLSKQTSWMTCNKDKYVKRVYYSSQRKIAKSASNSKVRNTTESINYSGYKKCVDYSCIVW